MRSQESEAGSREPIAGSRELGVKSQELAYLYHLALVDRLFVFHPSWY
jgi:hypothetical protein